MNRRRAMVLVRPVNIHGPSTGRGQRAQVDVEANTLNGSPLAQRRLQKFQHALQLTSFRLLLQLLQCWLCNE